MSFTPEDLRETMRKWGATVTIVASQYDGVLAGMTVTSFTSVSLQPPQVLVCIERGTQTHRTISAAACFAVSILSENQADASTHFSEPSTEAEGRFANTATHTSVTGAPVLNDAIAYLDCKVINAYDAGTHTIFVGLVESSGVLNEDSHPLVYYDRAYRRLT